MGAEAPVTAAAPDGITTRADYIWIVEDIGSKYFVEQVVASKLIPQAVKERGVLVGVADLADELAKVHEVLAAQSTDVVRSLACSSILKDSLNRHGEGVPTPRGSADKTMLDARIHPITHGITGTRRREWRNVCDALGQES